MSIITNPIRELIDAKGSIAKKSIIAKYKDNEFFTKFLYYALDPLKTYNVSEAAIVKYAAPALEEIVDHGIPPENPEDNVFNWCERLSSQNGISNVTLAALARCLYQRYDKQDRELYIKLLSKTLRLGVTASTVNKIIPDLIPVWEVQQSFPIDKYPLRDGAEFWVTQKLNGVRATYRKGELISRSGKPYTGLDHIISEIKQLFGDGIVCDGELTLKRVGEFALLNDNEAFRYATGVVNSDDDAQKVYIMYTIFDIVDIDNFDNGGGTVPYKTRRMVLDNFAIDADTMGLESIEILPVLYHGSDQKMIWSLLDKMVAEDKEGLMININVPYRRKRHRGILKVKRFYTMDLPIVRCEEGSGRLAGTLGALVLDFDGNEVNVGSGFSDEQRTEYWSKADDLEGTLCEVKYKEISSDKKTGARSLQFPVFMGLRTDKTEVSYG